MAIIPIYEPRSQQDAPGLQAFNSGDVAAARSEAIGDAGKGVVNLGLAMMEREKAANSLARNQAELAAKTAALQHADDVQNEVVMTTKADGSAAVPDFDTKIKSRKEAYMQSVDPKWAPYASTAYDSATQVSRSQMSDYSRKMFNENAKAGDESLINDMSAAIRSNPRRFDLMKGQWDSYVDSLVQSKARSPLDGVKMKQLGAKAFSTSVIDSYKNMQDPVGFKLAKDALNGSIGANFSPDDRDKMVDDVNQKEMSFYRNQISASEYAVKIAERNTKQKQQENFKLTLADLSKISEIKDGPQKAVAVTAFKNNVRLRVASGDMDASEGDRLVRTADSDLTETQEKNVAPFFRQVFDEVDLNGLKNKVDASFDNGSISAGDRVRILKEIDSEQDRRRRAGEEKKSRPEVNAVLDNLVGRISPEMVLFQWKHEKDLKLRITTEFYDRMRKGQPLLKIRDAMAAKYFAAESLDKTQTFIHGVNVADPQAKAQIMKLTEPAKKLEALKLFNKIHGPAKPEALPKKKGK